jgi:hypothetical protein
VKVGFDIQLFKRLTEEPNPSHVEHLAGLSGADSDFLREIFLAWMSSMLTVFIHILIQVVI